MINLFKKNIHSFLSFTLHTTTTDTTTTTTTTISRGDHKLQLQRPHQPISGLGLVTATSYADRPLNVLESATLKSNSNPPPPSPSGKRIGFIDDIGGGVDGLMCCTESLGFESSDERRVDDQIDQIHSKNNKKDDDKVNDIDDDDDGDVWRRRMMMKAEGRGKWRKVRSFPPPLSSLNRNGKPSFFLRPVRKDGRLELTEVRIQRPEILHVSRHDGRLTLHLIPDQSILEEEEEEEELDALLKEEEEEEEEEVLQQEAHALLEEEIMVDDDDDDQEEEEEGEVVEEIRYGKEEEERVGMGGNEGLRRCHEMVNQHHHHVHGSHHHHHHMRMCGINISVPC